MKKLCNLLLTTMLVLAMTACSSDAPDRDADTSSDAIVESSAATQDTAKEPETTPAPEATEVPEKELTRGTIDGNVYTNDYLELTFTKPETWAYYTDEQIAATMNMSVDFLNNKTYEDVLEANAVIYDMMVIDPVTYSNISMAYENMKLTVGFNITEDQYIEAMKLQLANITGMDITFSDEIETVKLGGMEYKRISCTNTTNGVTMTQVYYFRAISNYMAMFTATLTNDSVTIADIEAMFQ